MSTVIQSNLQGYNSSSSNVAIAQNIFEIAFRVSLWTKE